MVESVDNLRAKRNLTALVEFSRIINSRLDLNFILNNILLTCLGKFLATKGFIALYSDEKLIVKTSKGITENSILGFPNVSFKDNLKEHREFQEFLSEYGLCAVENINVPEGKIGVVCLGEKLNKSPYTDDDLEFLKTILNISAAAIQNSLTLNELTKVNRVLDSRINRLSSLFELSKEFGMFSESTKVARLLVYSVIGQFLVSKFAVVVFENNGMQILESKFPESDLIKAFKNYDYKKFTTSFTKDEIINRFPELQKLNIELIVPMQMQGETKGLILLAKRINNIDFTGADIEFIYSVGSLAIISIENKRLFIEALEKQKMEEELEIARDIQKNLLPQTIPSFCNFEIAADNTSSKQVGGDYYDVIQLDDNRFCFAIADVSGKGVPASLLMANIQAFLKVITRQDLKIDEATGLMNDLITENTTDGKFITFFWGICNNKDKTVEFVNAGHNPPLLIRDGKIEKLEAGGIILGVIKTLMPYTSQKIQLQKDDVILLFTDGVSEAMNKEGEEFSDEKLESLSLSLAHKPAEEILAEIKKEVQVFSSGTVQSDDITLLVIKVK